MRDEQPQATTMEALLVWSIQDQKADRLAGGGFSQGYAPVSADGVARMLAFGQLGVMIDCSKQMTKAIMRANPDADTVVEAVERIVAVPRCFLVLHHARLGTRPDWRPDLYPVMPETEWVYEDNRRRAREFVNGRTGVRYCKIVGWRDMAREMVAARGLYLDWWSALAHLAEHFMAVESLRQWRVVGVGPPRRPWCERERCLTIDGLLDKASPR